MIKTSATVPLQYDTGFSPFAVREFDDALTWLESNGFDGIELCVAVPRSVDAGALSRKLRLHRLAVSAISTGQARSLEGISLTDSVAAIRAKAVQRVKEHIELSAQIGCPPVTIGLLRGAGGGDNEELLCRLADALEQCAAYARPYGVKLMIEPINRYETTLLNSVGETLRFLSSLDASEQVGVLFDTFHANIEEPDIGGAIEILGDKLLHVHFADSNRWLPGMGHIDFRAVYVSLRKLRFGGYASLETLNLPDKEAIKAGAHQSLTRYSDAPNARERGSMG